MPEPNLGLRESIKLIRVGGNASVLVRYFNNAWRLLAGACVRARVCLD